MIRYVASPIPHSSESYDDVVADVGIMTQHQEAALNDNAFYDLLLVTEEAPSVAGIFVWPDCC